MNSATIGEIFVSTTENLASQSFQLSLRVGCLSCCCSLCIQKKPICNYVFLWKGQSLISKYLLAHILSKSQKISTTPEGVQFITFLFCDFTSDQDQISRLHSLRTIVFHIDPAFVISMTYLLGRKDMTRHMSLWNTGRFTEIDAKAKDKH